MELPPISSNNSDSRTALPPYIGGQVIFQSRIIKGLCFTLLLSNHQAVEEGAVVLQGLAKILSSDIIALIPLTLQ